jgi:hypothetical protein
MELRQKRPLLNALMNDARAVTGQRTGGTIFCHFLQFLIHEFHYFLSKLKCSEYRLDLSRTASRLAVQLFIFQQQQLDSSSTQRHKQDETLSELPDYILHAPYGCLFSALQKELLHLRAAREISLEWNKQAHIVQLFSPAFDDKLTQRELKQSVGFGADQDELEHMAQVVYECVNRQNRHAQQKIETAARLFAKLSRRTWKEAFEQSVGTNREAGPSAAQQQITTLMDVYFQSANDAEFLRYLNDTSGDETTGDKMFVSFSKGTNNKLTTAPAGWLEEYDRYVYNFNFLLYFDSFCTYFLG